MKNSRYFILVLILLMSFKAAGCGALWFGAGAATGAAVADDDIEAEED